MSAEDGLTELRDEINQLQARAAELSEKRDGLIREALAGGESATAIAEWSGLSRPRIYQIRDRTR